MEYIQKYIEYLYTSKYSNNSIESFESTLKNFEQFCRSKGINHEKEVTESLITLYINERIATVTNRTFANYLVRVKSYFAYLEQEGYIFISPLREVDLPFVDRQPAKILTEQEVLDIFDKVDTTNRTGIKLRTMLELLYSSALRPCELVNLKKNDLDFKNKSLFIAKSKNLKDRIVPVGETALYWISVYINEVRTFFHPENTSPYLFLSNKRKARKLNRNSLYHFMKPALARKGVKVFYPSILRPSCASHLLSRGMHIRYIQKMLGHTDIRTTQIYLRIPLIDLKKHISPNHPADTRTKQPYYTGDENNEL